MRIGWRDNLFMKGGYVCGIQRLGLFCLCLFLVSFVCGGVFFVVEVVVVFVDSLFYCTGLWFVGLFLE
jgi:hypothetical protein